MTAIPKKKDIDSLLGNARSMLAQGRLGDAHDHAKRALSIATDILQIAEIQMLLGEVFRSREEWSTAVAHFRKATEIDTENKEAWLGLAESLESSGKGDDWKTAAEKTVQLGGGDSSLRSKLADYIAVDEGTDRAKVQIALNQNEEAEKTLKELIPLLPSDPKGNDELRWTTVLLQLGQVKRRLGKYEELEACSKKLLSFKKVHDVLLFRGIMNIKVDLAVALKGQNKMEELDTLVKEVLAVTPDDSETLFQKGLLLGSIEHHYEAVKYLRQSLKMDRFDARAMHRLKFELETIGDARTQFWCPHCQEKYTIPVYPTDPAGIPTMVFYIKTEDVIPDSVRHVSCRSCGRMTALILWVCRNCLEGYAGSLQVRVDPASPIVRGQGRETYYHRVGRACDSCEENEPRVHIRNKDPREKRFFEGMLTLRPDLVEQIRVFDQVESEMNQFE
ncbi:MAG: tetratricopeptide repeat protein [Candidatus Thorarchaeota archaeon]